jgi:hypothetical protein
VSAGGPDMSAWSSARHTSRRLRVRGRARPGTFRERAGPCQHCGPRHDGRMRTASAATFRVDRALSLPPAARRRAFYRRHAAARSKAAAAGSRGSTARCIHRLSRAQSSTAGKRVTVSTGKSGRFTMFLAPGTYRLTGSSPRVHVNGQDALCRGASRSGQGWQVNARHRSLLLGTLTPCPPRARSGGP